MDIPAIGLVEFYDPETGAVQLVDTSSKSFQRDYKKLLEEEKHNRDQELKKAQVSRIDILSNEDFADPLIEFFKRRALK